MTEEELELNLGAEASKTDWLSVHSENPPAFWIADFRIIEDISRPIVCEIRRITFKTGINIVWSEPGDPDGTEEEKGRGHAAGKSSLCRALRYLLGEENYGDAFVSEHLRNNHSLNQAYLAATIWIGTTQWSVFRPLNKRKTHYAVKGQDIDSAREVLPKDRLKYDDFVEELARVTTHTWEVSHFDKAKNVPIRWLHLLQCLARDQEAHLSGIHNWRHPDSASESPDLDSAQRAFLMRCLFALADPNEPELLNQRANAQRTKYSAETTINSYEQVFQDSLNELRERIPEISQEINTEDEAFSATISKLAEAEYITAKEEFEKEIEELMLPEKEEELTNLRLEKAGIEGRISEPLEKLEEDEKHLRTFQSAPPETEEEKRDVCKIIAARITDNSETCGVPIDQAREECPVYKRCGIKPLELVELAPIDTQLDSQTSKLEAQIKKQRTALQPQLDKIEDLEKSIEDLTTEIDTAKKSKITLEESIEDAEETHADTLDLSRAITRAHTKQSAARASIISAESDMTTANEQLETAREENSQAIAQVSDVFSAVAKGISKNLTGELSFSKIETKAKLNRSGELVSSGYKALRCLTYDLTALVAKLNGIGHHPGFLLHDSPRESDLEPSLYQSVFSLIAQLAERSPGSFQSIITTTAAPPKKLQNNTMIRAKLSSDAAINRLYRTNL